MTTQTLETLTEPIQILNKGKEAEVCEFTYDCKIQRSRVCFNGYSKHCRVKRFLYKWGRNYLNKQKV